VPSRHARRLVGGTACVWYVMVGLTCLMLFAVNPHPGNRIKFEVGQSVTVAFSLGVADRHAVRGRFTAHRALGRLGHSCWRWRDVPP